MILAELKKIINAVGVRKASRLSGVSKTTIGAIATEKNTNPTLDIITKILSLNGKEAVVKGLSEILSKDDILNIFTRFYDKGKFSQESFTIHKEMPGGLVVGATFTINDIILYICTSKDISLFDTVDLGFSRVIFMSHEELLTEILQLNDEIINYTALTPLKYNDLFLKCLMNAKKEPNANKAWLRIPQARRDEAKGINIPNGISSCGISALKQTLAEFLNRDSDSFTHIEIESGIDGHFDYSTSVRFVVCGRDSHDAKIYEDLLGRRYEEVFEANKNVTDSVLDFGWQKMSFVKPVGFREIS